METSYQQMGAFKQEQRTKKLLIGALIVTCILLIAVSIVAGVLGGDAIENSPDNYCMTTDCLELAAEISASLNTSVDPCDDFYHYACDGWDNDNSWNEINVPSYGQFSAVFTREKEAFLDAMFYKTKASLTDHSSVEKAQSYFISCLSSSVDLDDLQESPFWANLVNETTFVDDAGSNSWTADERAAFHDALVYLTQMNYNSLFQLMPAAPMEPVFIQFIGLWQFYAQYNGTMLISMVYESWYQQYFGLNATAAKAMAIDVASFANALSAISTVTDDAYYSQDTLMAMVTEGDFSDLSDLDTAYVNYTKLVLDVYGVETASAVSKYQYLSGGVSFFEGLSGVVQSHSPSTVQAYILSSILYYYLDFKDTNSQSAYETRTDFCFSRTINAFPFVFGYVLFNTIYDDATYDLASSMTEHIKDSGVKPLIEGSSWLDAYSKAAALKKIENMDLYIGFPERVGDGDSVDLYYKMAEQDASVSWMKNLENMAQWDYISQNASFWGNAFNLTAGWPGAFEDPSSYDSWLTGINAFYYPVENWFVIPVTISQPPFLDGGSGYPSSVGYGGLGVVCGHEMSHGFDPSGSMFNWNGTYVGSIFSNESRQAYQQNMQCLIDQYDGIPIDRAADGSIIYDDGNLTITENVADNAGLLSSWTAWEKYIAENGDDKKLYGVDLSQEQLFFIGYARLWCETARPGANANWTDVHSPSYARVVAPLQNSKHFADAYGCKSGSFMNPTNKCSVW